jgi:putative ABC transport system substrate-binding protein
VILRRTVVVGLGAAITWPLAAQGQQRATPVIGFLSPYSPGSDAPLAAAFGQGLSEVGYVEKQNLAIEYRWAEGRYDRLPAIAADLVGRKVDVIAAFSPPAASAAKGATSTIPIVFSVGTDPIAAGLVPSLSRPSSNLTGVSILYTELVPKRLELLSELVPQTRVIVVLVNPNSAEAEPTIRGAQEAASAKRVKLHILKAATEGEIDTAFATLIQMQGALLVGADPFFGSRSEQIVALAARHVIPTIYFQREDVAAGGLISYGPSLPAVYRQVGTYVGKILNGAKPADLPVQQPTRFELVINLKTANALGLTVPQTLLARADEVIE